MKTNVVYLLHFMVPLTRVVNGQRVEVRHYLGSAINLRKRLNQHWTGRGTALTRAFFRMGSPFMLARTWEGDRKKERVLKNRHKSSDFCPLCNKEYKIC